MFKNIKMPIHKRSVISLIFCIMILTIPMILSGCSFISSISSANNSAYVSYVSAFGPNNNDNNLYYHYVKNNEGFIYSKICRYDIRTAEEKEVFALDNGDSSRKITDYYGDDNNLFVVVKGRRMGNKKSSLYHHDNNSGKDHIITEISGELYLIRTETGIIVGIGEGDDNSELRYYDLREYKSSFMLIETDKPDLTDLSSVSSSYRVVLEDGRSVLFTKNNGEARYSYYINGTSGDIEALTSKNALRSGIYNDFLVEGNKIIGVVQFTEWNYGGIGPKNILKPKDLKGSALFEFDINTCESKILYETKGSKTLIIGYSEGQIYLYRKGNVIRKFLSGEKEEVICSVDNNNHQLSFNWLNDTLLIFDEEDYVVVGSCNG